MTMPAPPPSTGVSVAPETPAPVTHIPRTEQQAAPLLAANVNRTAHTPLPGPTERPRQRPQYPHRILLFTPDSVPCHRPCPAHQRWTPPSMRTTHRSPMLSKPHSPPVRKGLHSNGRRDIRGRA